MPKDYVSKGISLPLKLIERNNMLPLAGMLFNVVSGLVMDKAQSLAKEHVEKMIDDVYQKRQRQNSTISSRTIQNIHLRVQRMPLWQPQKRNYLSQ